MTTLTATSSPDWALVPFDVGCARCGHDLRGLTESVCPSCSLEFDWSVAVPIDKLTCTKCDYHLFGLSDTRCPECGTEFTWQEALDEYHRKEKLLFEYRWRDRAIRSFLRTWLMTLRPKRFWSRLDMHDPPRIRPLLLFGAAMAVAYTLTTIVFSGVLDWSGSVGRQYKWYGLFDWNSILRIPLECLKEAKQAAPYLLLEHAMLWWCCSLLALLLFRQSMRKCRLRTAHVVRITTYAQFVILPLAVVVSLIPEAMAYFGAIPYAGYKRWVTLAAAVFVLWSIRCGYAYYAKMRHATAVAVSSQLIALLALDTLSGWIHGREFGGRLLLEFCELLGIPI